MLSMSVSDPIKEHTLAGLRPLFTCAHMYMDTNFRRTWKSKIEMLAKYIAYPKNSSWFERMPLTSSTGYAMMEDIWGSHFQSRRAGGRVLGCGDLEGCSEYVSKCIKHIKTYGLFIPVGMVNKYRYFGNQGYNFSEN